MLTPAAAGFFFLQKAFIEGTYYIFMKKRSYRVERDYLGVKKIPSVAYYGVQTKRALDTFAVSGLRLQKNLISAIALIKKAAALANMKDGHLEQRKAKAIIRACDDVLKGKLDDQFLVDVFQAGAGTSENMNLNEVIANRALEILRKKKGSYHIIHPHDDVNMSQSTNDVFHSAIHIAAYLQIRRELLPALRELEIELQKKANRWKNVVKSGRTHLRDALPITVGQEIGAYATTVQRDAEQIAENSLRLRELNLGGTAIGTGMNATLRYRRFVIQELRMFTGAPFVVAKNLIEVTQSLSAITETSASLKTLALDLVRIANDFRLLSSGPATGLGELELPAVQPGSSIMPGKVNPAVAEMLDMVGFQVVGNDTTIGLCAQAGQLELNVMMPLAAFNLLESIQILSRGIEIFTKRCVQGIRVNEKKCWEYVEKNPILVTALTPHIGYAKAAKLAKKAYKEGRTVRELVLEGKFPNKKTLLRALDAKKMTQPR